MRYMLLMVFLVLAACPARTQELRPSPRADTGMDVSGDPAFLLRQETHVFLPGFRDYDMVLQEREEEIALRNNLEVRFTLSELRRGAEGDLSNYLRARSNLGRNYAGFETGISTWEMLGRLLLQETIRYGYIYARESVRKASVTEFDYLYLPQGPGVTRTTWEVKDAALMRGEQQNWSVWRDEYFRWKNKPCPDPEPEK